MMPTKSCTGIVTVALEEDDEAVADGEKDEVDEACETVDPHDSRSGIAALPACAREKST